MAGDPNQALPILRALSTAINIRAMYPPGHPKVVESGQQLLSTLATCLGARGQEEITFLIIEHEFLFDDRPVRARGLYLAPLMRILKRLGVERLTLAAGLDEEEAQHLVGGLAGADELGSSPHVVLGRVVLGEVPAEPESALSLPSRAAEALSEVVVDNVERSFLSFASEREGSVAQLDEMLWQLVEGIDRSTRSVLLMRPVKSYLHQLFVHSMNVGLLTLAQARSLGIEGEALHDIGLAALLHDVGKMSLPKYLMEKRGRYTEQEWEVVKLHPELGAGQLCGLKSAPPLAVLVAYEHHLRWDGKPSYPIPEKPRKSNLASQLTAIADAYDVMIASRGLSGGVHGEAAKRVWRERSETYFDPFLVGNFVMMVSEAEHDSGQET
jgi:response regulator RpfG family c-di-GMP phosphodiesterase